MKREIFGSNFQTSRKIIQIAAHIHQIVLYPPNKIFRAIVYIKVRLGVIIYQNSVIFALFEIKIHSA